MNTEIYDNELTDEELLELEKIIKRKKRKLILLIVIPSIVLLAIIIFSIIAYNYNIQLKEDIVEQFPFN